jgi:hypothetical protein
MGKEKEGEEMIDNTSDSIKYKDYSPCLNCSCMREYYPSCSENCGLLKKSPPARYRL